MSRIEEAFREMLMIESKGQPPSTTQLQRRRMSEDIIDRLRAEKIRPTIPMDLGNGTKIQIRSLMHYYNDDELHQESAETIAALRAENERLMAENRKLREVLQFLIDNNSIPYSGAFKKVQAALKGEG